MGKKDKSHKSKGKKHDDEGGAAAFEPALGADREPLSRKEYEGELKGAEAVARELVTLTG